MFPSAERAIEKDSRNLLKDNSSLLHESVYGIVVDESHVHTLSGNVDWKKVSYHRFH